MGGTMTTERVEPNTPRKTMAGILIKVDWSLWGVLVLLAIYWTLRMATERSGPEGRGLGGLAVMMMFVPLALCGWGVRAAARRHSITGLVILAILMAWPLVFFIGEPIAKARRSRASTEQQAPRHGE
jgi:hypothetical protein